MTSVVEHDADTISEPTSGPPNFRGKVVEACEGYVEQFRRGEKAKVDVVKSIYGEIFVQSPDTGDELQEFARNASFNSFLEKIDEISRTRSGAATRGKRVETNDAVAEQDVRTLDNNEVSELLNDIARGRGRSVSPVVETHLKRSRSPSTDVEKEGKSSKKPFIEAILPFIANRQSRITVTHLRPELQETLRCKKIYARDVAASKQTLICEPDCPQLPDTVWSDILMSKFVDLDRIFSALHSIDGDSSETYKVGDLELSAGPSKPKKHISTAGEWTSSFERYKQGVLFCYPHREKELNDYASHIGRQFTAVGDRNTTRVLHYDRAVRAEASRGNQFLLTDYGEWNHLYTAYIVTPGAVSQSAASTSEGKRSRNGKSNDICQRFNQGRCTNNNDCRYRHACSLCGSKAHALPECTKLPTERRK